MVKRLLWHNHKLCILGIIQNGPQPDLHQWAHNCALAEWAQNCALIAIYGTFWDVRRRWPPSYGRSKSNISNTRNLSLKANCNPFLHLLITTYYLFPQIKIVYSIDANFFSMLRMSSRLPSLSRQRNSTIYESTLQLFIKDLVQSPLVQNICLCPEWPGTIELKAAHLHLRYFSKCFLVKPTSL